MRSVILLVLLVATAPAEKPRNRQAGTASVNGTSLHYEIAGRGEPVVLIHGGFMDGRMWDAQFPEFARAFRVLRYDVRGAGRSARNYAEPYSSVEDLAALMKHLGIEKAHIVGLSAGGELAINFVLAHPERALSLVAAEAGLSGFPFQGEGMELMRRVFTKAREQGPESAVDDFALAPVFASMAKNNRAAHQRLKTLLRDNAHLLVERRNDQPPQPPAAERLGDIRVPTLVLVSEHEGGYAAQVADRLMGGVPGARKQLIHNSGHMMNMEQPKAFNRAVLDFLRAQKLSSATRRSE